MSWQRATAAALPCLLLLAACEGDRRGRPTGDTAFNEYAACDSIYRGPVSIDDVNVVCTADDRLRFFVSTVGWTSDATVFSQATGAPKASQLADEHDVMTFKHGPCQDWDRLEQKLQTDVDIGLWEPNASTALSCDPEADASHANPKVMTYVVRAYDLDGNLADCVALGHDPAGLLAGAYDGSFTPTHPEELKQCSEGLKGKKKTKTKK